MTSPDSTALSISSGTVSSMGPSGEPSMGKAMTVGLVIPPSAFLLDERVFVSLGILKVAAILEQNGHCVRVIDLSGIKNYEDALSHFLETETVDVLGVTATTPQLPAVTRIVQVVRQQTPKLRLIPSV